MVLAIIQTNPQTGVFSSLQARICRMEKRKQESPLEITAHSHPVATSVTQNLPFGLTTAAEVVI